MVDTVSTIASSIVHGHYVHVYVYTICGSPGIKRTLFRLHLGHTPCYMYVATTCFSVTVVRMELELSIRPWCSYVAPPTLQSHAVIVGNEAFDRNADGKICTWVYIVHWFISTFLQLFFIAVTENVLPFVRMIDHGWPLSFRRLGLSRLIK